ncbi:MAG: hydroxyacid dehydrogenase [Burkholderiaceae bacterium]
MKSALFYDYPPIEGDVFSHESRERIAAITDLYPHVVNGSNFEQHAAALADVEVIFATWGMIRFNAEHFKAMPRLRAVFYAAGNVKAFAEPLIERDVLLVSAWQANAIPVAEMCLSQILLSLRGYFRSVRQYREMRSFAAKQFSRPGVQGATVAMIGMGKIGQRLTLLLQDYPLKVIAYDPFLTTERANQLNVEHVTLDQVFSQASVVCNHMPDLPTTRAALKREHFTAMREGATFINTGRGAQVIENDLVEVLINRPDLTALLDVSWPEPPALESALWRLPNVIISPHIGGTTGNEVVRLVDLVIAEFEAWQADRPLQHQITARILSTMG